RGPGHDRGVRARDPRSQDQDVRARGRRDGGDPRGLAAARFVRGRDLPPLGRLPHAGRPEASVRRARASPPGGTQALPVVEGAAGLALSDPAEGRGRVVTVGTEPARRRAKKAAEAPTVTAVTDGTPAGGAPPELPPEWRSFVGRWLESMGCT